MHIITKNLPVEVRERMRDGQGHANLSLIDPGVLPPNCRLIGMISLEPGCSIGSHTHQGECEMFFVSEGNPKGIDEGKEIRLSVGDVFITCSGETHSLINDTDGVCTVFAAIITG